MHIHFKTNTHKARLLKTAVCLLLCLPLMTGRTFSSSAAWTVHRNASVPSGRIAETSVPKETAPSAAGQSPAVSDTGKDAGDYTATATLAEGYTWTDGSTDAKEIAWSIAPAELTEVTLSETVFYYNGEVQRPDVVEVKAGDLIVPFEDYLVVYESGDTKDPGTYRVYVRKEFGKNIHNLREKWSARRVLSECRLPIPFGQQ